MGMGADLYEQYPLAREIYKKANDIMGMELSAISFDGPEESLKQTQYTQPAIFVHSLVAFELAKEKGLYPNAVAGHSLGEYSALVAAEGLSFEDALSLVKLRGKLMQNAGEISAGTMAAVIGLDNNVVADICSKIDGVVVPANFNCPGQLVISGEVQAVHKAMLKMQTDGARIVKELVVSGAFHSPLMKEAVQGLEEALVKAPIKNTNVPIYQNIDGKPSIEAGVIKEKLLAQITGPVNWQGIIENMLKDGFDSFYELGPGNVLKGLLKRIDRKVPCGTFCSVADFLV